MKYVKKLLSVNFKEVHKELKTAKLELKLDIIDFQGFQIVKQKLYPPLRELIYVSRLIMSMQDIEVYLMPYKDMCLLEQELCKPLNVKSC